MQKGFQVILIFFFQNHTILNLLICISKNDFLKTTVSAKKNSVHGLRSVSDSGRGGAVDSRL